MLINVTPYLLIYQHTRLSSHRYTLSLIYSGWHRRSSRRLKTENSENPNLETLHERPKHLDDLQQQQQQKQLQQQQQQLHKKSKSPEPKPPTPTNLGGRGGPPVQAAKQETVTGGAPTISTASSIGNSCVASESHMERRASVTNVVRPMVQQHPQQPPQQQQQSMAPVTASATSGIVVPPVESLCVYSARPMSTLRPPQVDDTDTSTGGESPVLMRRRTYHSLKETTGNTKIRHSMPVKSGEKLYLYFARSFSNTLCL